MDFDYSTVARAYARLSALGLTDETMSSCNTFHCFDAGSPDTLEFPIRGEARVEVRGRATDCVEARAYFSHLRIRRCEATAATSMVGPLQTCR